MAAISVTQFRLVNCHRIEHDFLPLAIYSAGEEKSPYFLFHGETALCKILKFQGETANFSEKFQGEIAEFLRENMELYRQNLKISGRNTGTVQVAGRFEGTRTCKMRDDASKGLILLAKPTRDTRKLLASPS